MNDYDKLKLNKNFIKHREETGLDCHGESYNNYTFCFVCTVKESCKDVTQRNRIKHEEHSKLVQHFTPDQIAWLNKYIDAIVSERIDQAFSVLQESIEGEAHESV